MIYYFFRNSFSFIFNRKLYLSIYVSNDSQKGIGLGLAICKAIIQAHGGKIWAKDETDGACFIFTIPSDKELNV